MSTSIVPTGGLRRSDPGSPVPSSPSSLPASPASSSAATSIVPTTGGHEGSGASAGVAAGVAVGLVLAVVVVVAVVVVIVFAALCSVQRRRKRSGRTCHVSADTLLATDDSASTAMTVIRNQTVVTYDEIKEGTSGGDEAGCVQYDYARPTDVARGVMGLEPHDVVVLMYEPVLDEPCAAAKVSQTMQLQLLHHIANKCRHSV